MAVTKKTVSAVFAGAVAAAATTGWGIDQAHAAGTWHVKNAGTGYHGIFKGAGTGSVRDTTKNLTLRCSTALSGTIPSSNTSGPEIGTISRLGFSNCAFLGLNFKANATASMVGSSYAGGVVHGRLGRLRGTISGVGNTCRATFSGSESFSFGTGHLTIDARKIAKIHITTATGCPFATGDAGYLAGTYTITVPSALTISQS